MKKKILLSSIVTIGLCLCMIAGSTFALFTSEDKLNVAVTSGTVSIDANIDENSLKLSSIKDATKSEAWNEREGKFNYGCGSVELFGETYYYKTEPQTDKFLNGGTAKIDSETGKLVIDNITPGDKITFTITTENGSNVNINTRIVFDPSKESSEALAKALKVSVVRNGVDTGVALADGGFTSSWENFAAGKQIGTYIITIELPAIVENYDAEGNALQNQKLSFDIILQAVQANEEI